MYYGLCIYLTSSSPPFTQLYNINHVSQVFFHCFILRTKIAGILGCILVNDNIWNYLPMDILFFAFFCHHVKNIPGNYSNLEYFKI